MRIINAKVYVDGAFVDGGIEFKDKIICVGEQVNGPDTLDEKNIDSQEQVWDAQGCMIIPGLIDIHTHAAVGEDASDGSPEGIVKMGKYYAAEGVTSWCPTTMTLKEPELTRAMHAIRAYERPEEGARVVGINLEGPFLSRAKKGAQNEDNLHAPDVDMLKRLIDASGNLVCLVSVAPEEPGAIEFIREASKLITVSVGHTAATYEQAKEAYDAGASHATHLFNGMPSIHHRNPGMIPAASEAGATAELIVDGLHIHPSVVRMTSKLFGKNLVMISDSLRCAGMPDGEYMLGGQSITMKNGKATLTGTDTLAGSSVHLMECIRRAVRFGLSLEDAIYAATLAPAKAIKKDAEIGSLEVGKCADFVIIDDSLNVKSVYIDGVKI